MASWWKRTRDAKFSKKKRAKVWIWSHRVDQRQPLQDSRFPHTCAWHADRTPDNCEWMWILAEVGPRNDQGVESHLDYLTTGQASHENVAGLMHHLHPEPREPDERHDQQNLCKPLHHARYRSGSGAPDH